MQTGQSRDRIDDDPNTITQKNVKKEEDEALLGQNVSNYLPSCICCSYSNFIWILLPWPLTYTIVN